MGTKSMTEDFAEALCRFVSQQLQGQDGVYAKGAIRIIDARNSLFATADQQMTDEAADIYAIAELCHTDEDMRTVPDLECIRRISRVYF